MISPELLAVALEEAGRSPCQSKRGVVVFDEAGFIVGTGHNRKPKGFDCDGSNDCKATCRSQAVHAEQWALLDAGPQAYGRELMHVKAVNGLLVTSGSPSCVQCSKLILAAGVEGVWLFRADGLWHRYDATEFHMLSIANDQRPPR